MYNRIPCPEGYGVDDAKTREIWFQSCLDELEELGSQMPATIAFPFKIGCNLAGGNWEHYEAMIISFAASNPDVKVAIVSQPQDAKFNIDHTINTNTGMREYRLLRLDHPDFANSPFCDGNIRDKLLTQNDLDYLYQSYIYGNIPIDTYNFLTIGHNTDIAGNTHKRSIINLNIHTQVCKFLRGWLFTHGTSKQHVNSSYTNNKSWTNTVLCVRANDLPLKATGEQLFMFVGKSSKHSSGTFQSRASFLHVDNTTGASIIHPPSDWEFAFIWTPKAVSYNRQRKDAKCLKHAVAAFKPENSTIPKEPDPRQPNDDEAGCEFTCVNA